MDFELTPEQREIQALAREFARAEIEPHAAEWDRAVARHGRSVKGVGMPADDADLVPLLDAILDTVPAPTFDVDAPLQALVTNLDASEYLGRLAIGRVMAGVLRKGEQVAVCQRDLEEAGSPVRRRMSQLYAFHGIGREEVAEVSAGDLFIVAGIPEVEVGDTLRFRERVVVCDSSRIDTLLAIPI